MTLVERVKKLKNVSRESICCFEYSVGNDVWHCNEGHVEKALESTNVAQKLAEVITNTAIMTSEYGEDILEEMREAELLEDYDRGSNNFEGYVTEVIQNNTQEHGWISHETERYDHKRGFTTLTTRLQCRVEELDQIQDPNLFLGWTAVIRTADGTLALDG